MLQSNVFANGSTTFPKPVREALGVEVGDTVRYFISGDRIQALRTRSVHELAGMLSRDDQAAVSLCEMENAIIQSAIGSDK
jgi:bifunctional DNA-binding transcriptional regulator/antitoxin component of YhaV-PrlF toxin-antitoxin module